LFGATSHPWTECANPVRRSDPVVGLGTRAIAHGIAQRLASTKACTARASWSLRGKRLTQAICARCGSNGTAVEPAISPNLPRNSSTGRSNKACRDVTDFAARCLRIRRRVVSFATRRDPARPPSREDASPSPYGAARKQSVRDAGSTRSKSRSTRRRRRRLRSKRWNRSRRSPAPLPCSWRRSGPRTPRRGEHASNGRRGVPDRIRLGAAGG